MKNFDMQLIENQYNKIKIQFFSKKIAKKFARLKNLL